MSVINPGAILSEGVEGGGDASVSTEPLRAADEYYPQTFSGTDGWLYSRASESLREVASAAGNALTQRWCEELAHRHRTLAGKGVRYFHVCVPDKSTIMEEYVGNTAVDTPGQIRLSALERLSRAIDGKLGCLVNPVDYLRRQKGQYPLYWKTDTRWTPWSSYMAYQLLCSQLGVNGNNQLLGYPFDEAERTMNLNSRLNHSQPEHVRFYRFHLRSECRYANPLSKRREQLLAVDDPLRTVSALGAGAQSVFENHHREAVDQCVVIFGDENSADSPHLFTGMLAETFAEVHFVWAEAIDMDYVETVKPDIVITQCAEHRLLEQPASTISVREAAVESLRRLNELPVVGQSHHTTRTGSVREEGQGFKVLLAPEQYALDPPQLVQQHGVCESPETQMCSNEVTLLQVRNVEVFFSGPSWRVQDQYGKQWLNHEMPAESLKDRWRPRRVLKGTTLMLATSAGAHCYYHWMLEILPKLGLLEREGISINAIDQVLVRKITGEWQRETLSRFGITGRRIVETVDRPYMRCEKLLHIELNCGINLKMNRFTPQWMKHLYAMADTAGQPRLKLYISRPAGVRRGIMNEAELLPMLRDAGFTITAMEGLSVAEQAALLSRADVLMSPHGGGLTNMVFCRPGITVIELFSRHVFPYYYGLAASCGHHYHAILENPEEDYARLVNATVAQSFADTQNETADLPFAVSLDAVAQVLGNLQL